MKRILVFIFVVMPFCTLNAQTLSDVFSSEQITFCGIDFNQAAFIGPINDFPSATVLKTKTFKDWNNLLYDEKDKYNITKATGKEKVVYDFMASTNSNMLADTNQMKVEAGPVLPLNDERIQAIVNGYANEHETDVAMVFVVEYFDKNHLEAVIHVVFFAHNTGKVLLSKSMVATPRGFGIRNYWARPFYDIITQIEKTEWKKWKKEAKE